jgi:lysozyme
VTMAPTLVEGIDVSAANGEVNWARVAGAGIEFAILKASEGVKYEDPRFKWNASHVREVIPDFTAYHYLRVRRGLQDADEQAREFCDLYEEAGCTLFPILDCELSENAGATGTEWRVAMEKFLDVSDARLKCPTVIYTFPAFWVGKPELVAWKELAARPLHIAHYTAAARPWVPGPWEYYLLWQYAAGAGVIGHVAGVNTVVDRNRLAPGLTLDALRRVKQASCPASAGS